MMLKTNPSTASPDLSASSMLTFRLGKQIFALPITNIQQIIEMVTITPIPDLNEKVEGVINFHGTIVAVVDLSQFLEQTKTTRRLHTPIVITNLYHHLLGIIVDEVLNVLTLPAEKIIPSCQVLPEVFNQPTALKGVFQDAQDLVLLLDLNQLFQSRQVRNEIKAAQEAAEMIQDEAGLNLQVASE